MEYRTKSSMSIIGTAVYGDAMRFARMVLFVLFASTVAQASSQEVQQVDERTLQQHLDHKVDAVYPAIAKAKPITYALLVPQSP